jgi:hypothetical protein
MANGPISQGLLIRHICNNPGCVNPAHLLAGTSKENMADAIAAGTAGGHGRRLTDKDVAEVVGLLMLKWSNKEISHATGVGFTSINQIKNHQHREDAISDELDRVLAAEEKAAA